MVSSVIWKKACTGDVFKNVQWTNHSQKIELEYILTFSGTSKL